MKYINWQNPWFPIALLITGLLFIVGCDQQPKMLEPEVQSPTTYDNPYQAIEDQQYEALTFVHTHLQKNIEKAGKQPTREQQKTMIRKAHRQWLGQQDVDPKTIDKLFEELESSALATSLTNENSDKAFRTMLVNQGFSKAQQRYMMEMITTADASSSAHDLKQRLQALEYEVRQTLGAKKAEPVLVMTALIKGTARFVYGPLTLSQAAQKIVELQAGKSTFNPHPNCRRDPDTWDEYWSWREVGKSLLTGAGIGCGLGASILSVATYGTALGCMGGSVIVGGVWIYNTYYVEKESHQKTMMDWCDECFSSQYASRSSKLRCKQSFRGRYHENLQIFMPTPDY